jgi:hypothetical protein
MHTVPDYIDKCCTTSNKNRVKPLPCDAALGRLATHFFEGKIIQNLLSVKNLKKIMYFTENRFYGFMGLLPECYTSCCDAIL